MLEMVEARRNADKVEEHYDLFSGLLEAAQDEPGSEATLSDEELMGGYLTLRSFGIFGNVLLARS
jgi:cytochrome P450